MAPCNTSINKMYEAQQNTKVTPRTNKKKQHRSQTLARTKLWSCKWFAKSEN